MFSAVSLEGIINSKKFKKIQNLGNLALFVQEIMCAKIEVIWRWSKNSPSTKPSITKHMPTVCSMSHQSSNIEAPTVIIAASEYKHCNKA